jgi:hypothetical protein
VLKLFPGTFYGEENFPLDLTNRATTIVSAVPRAAVMRCSNLTGVTGEWCIRFRTDQSPNDGDSPPLYQLRDLLFLDFDAPELVVFGVRIYREKERTSERFFDRAARLYLR